MSKSKAQSITKIETSTSNEFSLTKSGMLRHTVTLSAVGQENATTIKNEMKSPSKLFNEAVASRSSQTGVVLSPEVHAMHSRLFMKYLKGCLADLNRVRANTVHPKYISGEYGEDKKFLPAISALTQSKLIDYAVQYVEQYVIRTEVTAKVVESAEFVEMEVEAEAQAEVIETANGMELA